MPILNKHKVKEDKPARTIAVSFVLVILVGAFLLSLPISSRDSTFTPLNVSFFTATSATCVTGLVLVDTYQHWSYFGQGVILAMIQVGGLGLVTFATFFNFIIGRRLGLRKMQVASESVSGSGFNDIRQLLANIIKVSLGFELLGAVLLMIRFVPLYGKSGIFTSLFIAVSAFCNAGFDVLGRENAFISLVDFSSDPLVIFTVMMLIICGGLGFVVWYDIIKYRKTKHLELHTKVVLVVTGFLILSGTIIFLISEWTNSSTIGGMNIAEKMMNSMFHSVSCRTAGFNTIDMAELRPVSKIFSIILMYIGAAPGSTGGGIKVTTVAVVIMTVVSVLKNKQDTIIYKKRVDKIVIYKAITIIALSLTAITISSISVFYATSLPNHQTGINTAFECVSAFATVGLSSGVTAVTNVVSQIILMLMMFLGRVGPISVLFSLSSSSEDLSKKQIVPEGKIMVG